MSMDRSVEFLLEKYKTKQPNEARTTKENRDIKRNQRNTEKHQLADIIMIDLPLDGETNKEVHYLINHYGNLNRLNSRATKETVIGCLFFYIMKSHNNKVRIEDYRALLRLNVTYDNYSTVLTNMLKFDNLNKSL